MIQLKNIQKSFGKNEVLKDINLNIKKGEIVAILGPSGSGKSTLLRCINLLEQPNGGEIIYNSENILNKKCDINKVRQNIGMVFQNFNLFQNMTVLENIIVAPTKVKKVSKEEAISDALNLLDRVGLLEKKNDYPAQLSGGQKQRIAIARALLRKSSILILDDATSALDMETEYELLSNLNKRKGICTTFIIAHRISAVKNADIILYLENGEIKEYGTHQELLKLKGSYYEVYCEQFKDFNVLEKEVI